jgi:hypothetical protein
MRLQLSAKLDPGEQIGQACAAEERMADSNRLRALAEVVAAEAWHKAFEDVGARTDLHVDVVFGVGRIGGGDPSGVRFRLALRRAELVVIAPEHEPVRIDPASVRRDASKPVLGKTEAKTKVSKSAGLSLAGQSGVSTKGVKAEVGAKGNISLAAAKNRTVTATQMFKGMTVTQSQTPDGQYRWSIEPALGEATLAGRPWEADKAPRLQLVDQRPLGSKSMPPTVRIEVRCLREDLEISQIKLDDPSVWAAFNRRKAARNRMVAAEAAIRTLLTEEGLVTGDMSDPYAQLILAMTITNAI